MPRIRVVYNESALFVGPAPSTGYHFITRDGILTNNFANGDLNLVSYLPRVQEVNYSVNLNRNVNSQLGKFGSISDSISEAPTVDLNFSYLSASILPEARLGFIVNFPSVISPDTLLYSNTYSQFLLDGFYTRSEERPHTNALRYPAKYRDCRNFFLATTNNIGSDFNAKTTGQKFDYNNMTVIGFGDCYINSYSAAGSVGNFPIVNVGYTCDNIVGYASGSGISIPALNKNNYQQYSGTYATIPQNYECSTVGVLRPGDITLSITAYNQTTGINAIDGTGYLGAQKNIDNIGIDFSNLIAQSYNLSVPLARYPLKSISRRLPSDYKLSSPIFATLGASVLVSQFQTGQLNQLVNKDDEYDVKILLNNPDCNPLSGTAISYHLKRAKFNGYSYSYGVGKDYTVNLNWNVELSPENLNKGLFMSGQLNICPPVNGTDYILQEEGSYILTEEGEYINHGLGTALPEEYFLSL